MEHCVSCQANITKSNDLPAAQFKSKGATERRNFILGVLNGTIFKITMLLIDPQTVLAWFLMQLEVSNFYIGLISPIRMGSSFLLQIFVSGYLQKQP